MIYQNAVIDFHLIMTCGLVFVCKVALSSSDIATGAGEASDLCWSAINIAVTNRLDALTEENAQYQNCLEQVVYTSLVVLHSLENAVI